VHRIIKEIIVASQKRKPSTKNSKENSSSKSTVATTARPSERDFNPDYSYVIKDLKRIGILAGTFFGVMIILAIILS
jgi:hypothetical protein